MWAPLVCSLCALALAGSISGVSATTDASREATVTQPPVGASDEHFTARWLRNIGDISKVLQKDASVVMQRSVKKARNLSACLYGECCVPEFVRGDFDGLHRNLTDDLYGQHIVIDVLTRALRAHYTPGSVSDKPLVLSLHGQSGTGKTFVAQRVASYLFALGMGSRFVHHFVGRTEFPLVAELDTYRRQLAQRVSAAVQQCDRAMFIFDEMDKMPAGIVDNISSMLNHHESVGGVDYRRATFVFISNSHGEEIADVLHRWEVAGGLREDTRSVQFEPVLKLIAFNAGGLGGSSVISEDLVDHYVPFLPLERRHVKQCVRREFGRRGVRDACERLVEQIASEAATYNDNYSVSGCKRIDKTVAYYAVGL